MNKDLNLLIRENIISISIGFLLFLVFLNSTVTFYQIRAAEENKIVNAEVAMIKHRLNLVNTHVNLADMSLRGFMAIENDKFLVPFQEQVLVRYLTNYDSLGYLLGKHGYDSRKILPVKEKVTSYMDLISSLIKLRREQEIDKIIRILESDPGYEVWKVYDAFIKEATIFADDVAKQSLSDYKSVSMISNISQILLLLLGLPILIITILRIRKNNNVKKWILEIDSKSKSLIFDPKSEVNIHNEKHILDNLFHNLKKVSEFIKEITSGNYEIDWEGLNDQNKDANKENIVGDLINMREQMKTVREKDERRLWSTEGVSKFSEIVRAHQHDIKELCYEILSNLIKYVNANQGGIFLHNDDNPDDTYLELVACYAYERKKHIQKRIEKTEGLIGQAYLEQDIIFMTDFPQEYITIKSGLGDAPPSCILIVPLKYNSNVEAVLELASFFNFKPHEIELIQKIGEHLASAIAAVKVSVKTRILLENTQEQTEEMRTQEEEMRQHMEELQATQEEVQRRTVEYQQIIETNNAELDELREKLKQYESAAAK